MEIIIVLFVIIAFGYLKDLILSLFKPRFKNTLTVWCSELEEAEELFCNLANEGWSIVTPIEPRWNWEKFDYLYYFKLKLKEKP